MTLYNAKQPGEGLWDCCKKAPVKVWNFDNGSATACCASCAATYGRHNGQEWVTDLPEGWEPPTLEILARRVCETAREYHHLTAAQEDGDVYKRSQETFLAAIRNAYPAEDVGQVYGVWLDCMESIAYCVGVIHRDPEMGERLAETV